MKYVFYIIIIVLLCSSIHVRLNWKDDIKEGMVMNKFISQEYNSEAIKYILAIQNGENKEWWFVDKEYYNNISIGNWVKKYERN